MPLPATPPMDLLALPKRVLWGWGSPAEKAAPQGWSPEGRLKPESLSLSLAANCPLTGPQAPSPFKLLTVTSLALLDHVDKVVGEDERDSLAVDSKLGLEIPQKVAKVDVEQLRGEKDRDQQAAQRGSGRLSAGLGHSSGGVGRAEGPGWRTGPLGSCPQCPLPAHSHGS